MLRFPIRELSRLTGYSPAMIRYFEKAGVISPSMRSASGYRMFSEQHAIELKFVAEMQSLGFFAKQISGLRAIKSSDKPTQEKRKAMMAIFEAHKEYVEEKARHFVDIETKLRAKADTFAEGLLKDDR